MPIHKHNPYNIVKMFEEEEPKSVGGAEDGIHF